MPASIEARDLITKFVGELLREAKLSDLPEGFQETYRRQLEGQVMERLGYVALTALPAGDVPRVQELSEKEDHAALLQLFQKNIPDFPELAAKTLQGFRDQFLKSATAARATTEGGA